MADERKLFPTVTLRGLVILPEKVTHFDVTRKKSILAIEEAMSQEQRLFLVAQREVNIEEPKQEEVYAYGCIAEIKQVIKLPKGVLRVLIIGKERGFLHQLIENQGYLEAEVEIIEDVIESRLYDASMDEESREDQESYIQINDEAKIRELKELYETYLSTLPKAKKEIAKTIHGMKDLKKLVDIISANSEFDYTDAQKLLEEVEFENRYSMLLIKLMDEIEINTIKESIHQKVKESVDKSQREYILREQMKVIREELGDDTTLSDAEEFTKATEKLKASVEVKDKLKKEIKKLKNIQNNSAESGVIRSYIETIIDMPWNKASKDCYDLKYAKDILDSEHYGLEDVKERILEFLAVRALTNKGRSPILCLVGPPGTGKTSIAKSLANAMKKKYVRISLGGVRDEAEIRGHRRTYVGAMPGRVASAMKQAGTKNPLMLLDEIDKVSMDYKGDVFSALLEVLDSEQNVKFRDHYLELPLDLSDVLFVATANTLQTIPRPLIDRMEIIEISSYTEYEKVHIAKKHLVPKQLKAHGLTEQNLSISKSVIEHMAKKYTKESGVRQLERKIGMVCRKVAKEMLETEKSKIRITENNIEKYLGQEIYRNFMRNDKHEIGIVRGLAWTPVGGETLQIEVNIMPGKGEIVLTGQLGNIMKESARAAISYIRSIGSIYDIPDDYFTKNDIHMHVPEGAVPKDGPSAGITIATAILSVVIGKKVRADIAMTGEITLRGRVLPIGGLREKLLAAKNSGITTILIPVDNARDIEKIPADITRGLEIVPVDHMTRVCEIAFIN